MKAFDIKLSTIQDVRNFVSIVSAYNFDIDLKQGRYIVCAQSILGIFSLDLSLPLKVEAATDDCGEFYEAIKCFEVTL
jgi:PIN domain nuclease of toxin-antitoxin system